MLYTDPSGHFIDTALDIGFLAYDLYRVEKVLFTGCGELESELISLGLDAVGAALPFVTGLGMAARLGSKADDLLKLLRQSDNLTALLNKGDNIGAGARQLFDPDKLQRIVANLEKQGVYVWMDDETVEALIKANANAIYWPRIGRPGIIIWKPNPSRVEVIEELIHLGQNRKSGWVYDPSFSAKVYEEIEAQYKLLELAKQLGWTQGEIAGITKNLRYWLEKIGR